MKSIIATALAAATSVHALENSLAVKYGIKADSMISYDSIYFGYAPNYSPQVTMADLNGATGQKGATYNVYSQLNSNNVNSGSYSGNDQYNTDDIISSGAVLIASLMPEIQWTDVTSGLCDSIASFFENTFTSQGVTVWLRFAHEMNYYSDPASASDNNFLYPGGQDYSEFLQAWSTMYNAIAGNDMIYMYWSPNANTTSEPVEPWWPGSSQVDIVGMDVYPQASGASGLPTWQDTYGDFYNDYAAQYDLPFAIGETGTGTSGNTASIDQREAWLKNVINPGGSGFSGYPNYISATWFEYGPPANGDTFYVVYEQSTQTVTETISNTEAGSS